MKILIAEDDAIIALNLRQQIEARGYHVSAVVGRSEAVVSAVRAHRPDAVIMDIRLDGSVDGVTLAEEIFVCEDTPVVFLSAFADEATSLRAIQSGAYGYLTKPVVVQALISSVELAVHKHRDLRRRRTEAESLAAAVDALDASLVVLDAGGRVVFMNQAAVKLTGWMLTQAKMTPPPWVAELTAASGLAQSQKVFPATIRHKTGNILSVTAQGFRHGTDSIVYLISQAG